MRSGTRDGSQSITKRYQEQSGTRQARRLPSSCRVGQVRRLRDRRRRPRESSPKISPSCPCLRWQNLRQILAWTSAPNMVETLGGLDSLACHAETDALSRVIVDIRCPEGAPVLIRVLNRGEDEHGASDRVVGASRSLRGRRGALEALPCPNSTQSPIAHRHPNVRLW